MAKITKPDVIIPEIFDEAVQGAFAGKTVLQDSMLAQTGAVVIAKDLNAGQGEVGDIVKVPYFGTIGDFDEVMTDGTPLVPKTFGQTFEQAAVRHFGLAFEVSRWARSSVGGDIYQEGARQVAISVKRVMDSLLVGVATAAGGLIKDVYDVNTPKKLDWDLMVDGKMMWGDEQDPVVAMMVDSVVFGDLLKLKDSTGRPLLVVPTDTLAPRFMGVPIGTSDRLPMTGSSMATVVATGTSPPTVTLAGTPSIYVKNLNIDIVVGGTLGVATFKYSLDGGVNFEATQATAASVVLGDTGITVTFAAGTYNADNLYTSVAQAKHTTLLLKEGALAFWYNKSALTLQTDKDILSDTDVAAMHLYALAHRYKRLRGNTKPGIVQLRHN